MSNVNQQAACPSSPARPLNDSLWAIGWRRKGWLVLGLFIGACAGAAIAVQLPKTYQASAQISVVKKRPDAVTGIDTRPLSEDNGSPPQDLLRSTLIIERAIHSKGLAALPLQVGEDQDLVEHIRNSLTVVAAKSPSGPTGVYKLHFRARDPEACRLVLTALLESYRDFMDSKHQTIGKDTYELILRDKQSLEQEIAKNDAAYRAFRESAPLLGKSKDGTELRQERLTAIQAKRSALLLHKVDLEGQLKALEAALKEGRSQEVIHAMLADFVRKNDPADPTREKQVSAPDQLFPLMLEERKLAQIHGPKHPEVLEVRKRIETARRLMILPPSAWNSDDGAVDPVKLHLQLLKQKLQQIEISDGLLASAYRTEQDEVRRLAVYEIQNESFLARTKMNQTLYEALAKRLNEVSAIRNVGGSQIELLEPPSLGKKVAPSLMLALGIGAALGVGLGFAGACWIESRGQAKST